MKDSKFCLIGCLCAVGAFLSMTFGHLAYNTYARSDECDTNVRCLPKRANDSSSSEGTYSEGYQDGYNAAKEELADDVSYGAFSGNPRIYVGDKLSGATMYDYFYRGDSNYVTRYQGGGFGFNNNDWVEDLTSAFEDEGIYSVYVNWVFDGARSFNTSNVNFMLTGDVSLVDTMYFVYDDGTTDEFEIEDNIAQTRGVVMSNAVRSVYVYIGRVADTLPRLTLTVDTSGYNAGYTKGHQDGEKVGYESGYADGYDDGSEEDATVVSIFEGVADVALLPVNFFLTIFNFEILGINVRAFLCSLLTVACIVIVIKVVVGSSGGGGKDE